MSKITRSMNTVTGPMTVSGDLTVTGGDVIVATTTKGVVMENKRVTIVTDEGQDTLEIDNA